MCRQVVTLVLLASLFSSGMPLRNDDFFKLKSLEAELEMCFVRKVKTYCDTNMSQRDAAMLDQFPAISQPVDNSLSYVEDDLYQHIFENYQKNSIAKLKDGGTVQVKVGFTLIQLNHLDEKSQVLTTSGWMEVEWYDVRLAWANKTKFKSVENVVASSEALWLPDMALQNRLEVVVPGQTWPGSNYELLYYCTQRQQLSTRLFISIKPGMPNMSKSWTDHRLVYDKQKYPVDVFVVPPQDIWLPDIGLQNSATDIYHSSLVDNKFRVNIYPDGLLLWVPGGKFYTNCELDISYFPFDDQTCKLHFTNWAYNGLQMNLTVKDPDISLANYQVNGEWDILYTTAHRSQIYYECCGDTPYPSIYFTIYMRRKYLFYITNIIAPCIMLSILITLVFYLPPEAGEKVSLGITVLLSCIVFLLLIAESIPKRSDSVPIISIYLGAFLAITTTSIITTVVVLHVHHMGVRKVPLVVKKIVFDWMARMICMTTVANRYGTSSCRTQRHLESLMDTSMTSVMMNSSRNPSMLNSRHAPSRQSPTQNHRKYPNNNGRINGGMKKSFSITEDRIAQHILLNRNYVLEEILMYVKAFSQEKSSNEQTEATRNEWMAVAKVLDRFFMIIFMTTIGLTTIGILILLPMTKAELGPHV